jgi:hypothetical protein
MTTIGYGDYSPKSSGNHKNIYYLFIFLINKILFKINFYFSFILLK